MRRIRCCCWCWGGKDKVLLLMLRRFCCRCWVELRRIRCCCWCWGEKETLLFLLLLLLWQGPVFYCCWLKRIRCCSSSWGDEWLLLRWCYTIVVRMLRRYWRLFHLVVAAVEVWKLTCCCRCSPAPTPLYCCWTSGQNLNIMFVIQNVYISEKKENFIIWQQTWTKHLDNLRSLCEASSDVVP